MYFYPRPPRGGRRAHDFYVACRGYISIHALREEGDHRLRQPDPYCDISIHALREEGDVKRSVLYSMNIPFLSTPSARRATTWERWKTPIRPYFYPRPPRGGRRMTLTEAREQVISIHALREEGDTPVLTPRD